MIFYSGTNSVSLGAALDKSPLLLSQLWDKVNPFSDRSAERRARESVREGLPLLPPQLRKEGQILGGFAIDLGGLGAQLNSARRSRRSHANISELEAQWQRVWDKYSAGFERLMKEHGDYASNLEDGIPEIINCARFYDKIEAVRTELEKNAYSRGRGLC